MAKVQPIGQLLLILSLTLIGQTLGDDVFGSPIPPEEFADDLSNSSWTALPPPGAVNDIQHLDNSSWTALPPPGAVNDIQHLDNSSWTALPPPGAVNGIEHLQEFSEHIKLNSDQQRQKRMSNSVDDLGPPISPEEFAAAMANSSLTAPPPPGVIDAIEHSEEFQGDIKLSSAQQAQMRMGGRSAILSNAWVKGVIPYTISSDFTSSERLVIARAMAEYHNRTCIRFVDRTTENEYINIIDSSGCWSYVGRIGRAQSLSLKRSGCVHFGIVIHEFMHALGFWHEQSRYDRDKYVIINLDNVYSGREHNFAKKPRNESTNLGTKYDCGSVMHYSGYAFSKNGKPTISSKKCNGTLGQRNGFSETDVVDVNRRYSCAGGICRTSKKCKKQGGKCQKSWKPCSGTIAKMGCKKKMGCFCCITA